MSQPPPDDAVNGTSFEYFLKSLRQDVQPLICTSLLKLVAIQRQLNVMDGDMLKALARIELNVMQCMGPVTGAGSIRTITDSPANPQFPS